MSAEFSEGGHGMKQGIQLFITDIPTPAIGNRLNIFSGSGSVKKESTSNTTVCCVKK